MLAGIIARRLPPRRTNSGVMFSGRCAPKLWPVLLAQYFATNALATHIFPQGDELHLRRHDPDAHSEAA